MELQYVTFEQAQSLKKLGFDWKTKDFFHGNIEGKEGIEGEDNDLENYNCDYGDRWYSRPTVALALMWLRETKGLNFKPSFTPTMAKRIMWNFYIESLDCTIIEISPMADNYNEAESAALTKALELITKPQL